MYTAPLEDLIRSFDGVELMVYADDTKLYMLINSSDKTAAISQLEQCADSVRSWMTSVHLSCTNTHICVIIDILVCGIHQLPPLGFVVGPSYVCTCFLFMCVRSAALLLKQISYYLVCALYVFVWL